MIRADFDPVAIAQTYDAHGATCLSVLTDEPYFQGRLEYLTAIRAAVELPVLRKDFILDSYQLLEARAAGADAVLLIAECLDDCNLRKLHNETCELGMTPLVELYEPENLPRVLEAGATLIGVNNRNLHTFEVDLEHTLRLRARIPDECVLVSESGIKTHADVERLAGGRRRCDPGGRVADARAGHWRRGGSAYGTASLRDLSAGRAERQLRELLTLAIQRASIRAAGYVSRFVAIERDAVAGDAVLDCLEQRAGRASDAGLGADFVDDFVAGEERAFGVRARSAGNPTGRPSVRLRPHSRTSTLPLLADDDGGFADVRCRFAWLWDAGSCAAGPRRMRGRRRRAGIRRSADSPACRRASRAPSVPG